MIAKHRQLCVTIFSDIHCIINFGEICAIIREIKFSTFWPIHTVTAIIRANNKNSMNSRRFWQFDFNLPIFPRTKMASVSVVSVFSKVINAIIVFKHIPGGSTASIISA